MLRQFLILRQSSSAFIVNCPHAGDGFLLTALIQRIEQVFPLIPLVLKIRNRSTCRIELIIDPPDLVTLAQFSGNGFQMVMNLLQFFILLLQQLFVFRNQFFQQRRRIFRLHALPPADQKIQLFLMRTVFRTLNRSSDGRDIPSAAMDLSLEIIGILAELFLQLLVVGRMEQFPEDLIALLRICRQQFLETALGNHRNLCKLLPVNAEQLLNGRSHRLALGNGMTIRICQLGIRSFLLRFPRAVLQHLRPRILRISADLISSALEFEFHLDIGFRLFCRILASEHIRLAHPAGSLSVKRIGNRIEDRRLASSGITGNQIEAMIPEQRQIQHRLVCIWSECGHCQLQRSHACSPFQISLISF